MNDARTIFHILYRLRVDAILLAKILLSRGKVVESTLTNETEFLAQKSTTLVGESI